MENPVPALESGNRHTVTRRNSYRVGRLAVDTSDKDSAVERRGQRRETPMSRETRERHRNSESALPDLPDEDPPSLVHEDSVPGDVDGDLYELHQQVVASEERIANLEGELGEAVDQEAETAQILDSERKARAALDQQLHQAREEATRLILDKASQTRSAIRAEAEELLQASRVEAEREAGQVTKRAFDKANEMIAMARREAVSIVDAGRE